MAKVVIYSTPTCSYCKMAKKFFDDNKVKYEDKDVSVDEAAAQEMMKKTGQSGVPQIYIDGEVIVGFNEQVIKEKLKL